jgi:hypothetical protein
MSGTRNDGRLLGEIRTIETPGQDLSKVKPQFDEPCVTLTLERNPSSSVIAIAKKPSIDAAE